MNHKIWEVMTKLSDLYVKLDDNNRARAYRKAAFNIREHPTEITSGIEAKNINGVGKNIANKIDEFIKTGTIYKIAILEKELHEFKESLTGEQIKEKQEKEKKQEILEIFMKIHGVGKVTANKWYEMGYRKIQDLNDVKMNKSQKIGYKYYEEFQERIPRKEIDKFQQILEKKLEHDFMICGSYRRGCDDSGDIDCLLKNRNLKDAVKILKDYLIADLSCGTTKYMGVVKIDTVPRRIDIMVIDDKSWPYSTLYFTGSQQLNVNMRSKAIELNMTLNEYGLHDKNGDYYNVESEKEIFEILKIKYLEPCERNI